MTLDEVIFCANSGRVGSKYLARLIDTSREAHGCHEPDPPMNGRFLQMVEAAPEEESFHERLIKVRAIEEWMRRYATKPVYCETNHLFVVTFHDVAVATFPRMKVIFLRRSLPLVVKSFVELGFPARQPSWSRWHISPWAATAAIRPLGPVDELDPIDQVIAHLIDIEARGERFRAAHPDIPSLDVRLEDLGTEEGVERLFTALDLSQSDQTSRAIGTPIHARQNWKREVRISISLDECRERIARYLEQASRLGIQLPPNLALD